MGVLLSGMLLLNTPILTFPLAGGRDSSFKPKLKCYVF